LEYFIPMAQAVSNSPAIISIHQAKEVFMIFRLLDANLLKLF
jgi:hypothetical protein